MSRTFAALELSVSKDGNKLKSFSENIESADEKREISALLGALHKTKEESNSYLTTLVEQDKGNGVGGVVISHSKRKHADEGKHRRLSFVFECTKFKT